MNLTNKISVALSNVLRQSMPRKLFLEIKNVNQEFLFKLNSLSHLKLNEDNRFSIFIFLYCEYKKIISDIDDFGCITSSKAKKFARTGYDGIFNSFTIPCGYSYNNFYNNIGKEVMEHFNLVELVFSIIIREYIEEGIVYNFNEFCNLLFELHKIRYVLQKENEALSLNTIESKMYSPKDYTTLYEKNEIVVINDNLEVISSKTTYQNFLKGSKKN